MNELVSVTATIFRPGDVVARAVLEALDEGLWVFGKPDVKTIRDCIVDPSTDLSQFHVLAVHFAVQPLPNPDCVYPEGSLLALQLKWEWTPNDAFGGDLAAFYQIVQRRLLKWPNASTIQFIGVYDVESYVTRDEFDGKDSTVENHFLGELDMNAELPLSTAALEMELLRSMSPRISLRITDLAKLLKRDVAEPVFAQALTHLVTDDLIVSHYDFYYFATESAAQAVQA